MRAPEIQYETHTMRFPFTQILFGKSFEMPCEVVFEYTETDDKNFRIKVKSLIGTTEEGLTYDLMYLTEDEDSMYSEFIITGIIRNKPQWGVGPTGGVEWWVQQRT
jgi:hypothetical protein